MTNIPPILLVLGLLVVPADDPARASGPDVARLQEMLQDHEHPRGQSQAALLLVQSSAPEAEKAVHHSLRRADDPDVFLALAAAVHIAQDNRFLDDMLAALLVSRPGIRSAAAEALSGLTDPRLVLGLEKIVTDTKADAGARQAALYALGRTGRKAAGAVLVGQLETDHEQLRRAAFAALAELAGQNYGTDAAKWRAWWQRHKDQDNESWLGERLAFQTSKARRLDGDLERARLQVLRLHQQLYARLPATERMAYLEGLLDQDDASVRCLAVGWALEMLPSPDLTRQREVAQLLLCLTQDGSVEVQRSAVLALGRVNDPAAFERLKVLLEKGAPPVRAAAARALAAQARGRDADAQERQKQAVPALQKALEDPAIEVVIEAAEDLGTLGAPEAGPVLTSLLCHQSETVRQTAAQALERVADTSLLNSLLKAVDDPNVNVRFSLVGALGRAVCDGDSLSDEQRKRLLAKLEDLLLHDADPGVRSRAATVLGDCGPATMLPVLWKCVLAGEEARVQDKAWAALVETVARSASLAVLREWDATLTAAKQGPRRLQLLAEVAARWQKRPDTRSLVVPAQEMLVQAQLELGKWSAAFPVVRELLARQGTEAEKAQRLHWLLTVGEQALQEGNKAEAQRVAQEAQPFLTRGAPLADAFDKLAKQAAGRD
jgi:HEAT repeat protein